jgi:hypothetical protein
MPPEGKSIECICHSYVYEFVKDDMIYMIEYEAYRVIRDNDEIMHVWQKNQGLQLL